MAIRKLKPPPRPDDEIRAILLDYFFERNRNATSPKGKKTGAAVTIKVLRAELKERQGLSAQEVVRNLTYLLSQGRSEQQNSSSSFATKRGSIVPSVTPYYIITAAGIDKIEGPSAFTRDRFAGIRIEASGHNVITLGDGNRVSVQYRDLGQALSELREAISSSNKLDDRAKLDAVVDIDAIEDQLLKPNPNKGVIRSLWEGIEKAAIAAGLAASVSTVAPLIAGLIR